MCVLQQTENLPRNAFGAFQPLANKTDDGFMMLNLNGGNFLQLAKN